MGSYLSINTLNVSELNAPTKRQRLAEWIQKQDPYICCLQETHSNQGAHAVRKWRDGKSYLMQMETKKKAGVAILITHKMDFEIKAMKRDKEWHYIMIKRLIQDITIINIHAPNIGALLHSLYF